MKGKQRISKSEMIIMEYIWKKGSPVTTSEIMQNLPEEIKWSQKTVITFLSRLVKKGVLKSTRIGRAFHYEPCISRQEYLNYQTKQFINEIHKGSILGFISALCDNGDLTKEDIEKLMRRFKE